MVLLGVVSGIKFGCQEFMLVHIYTFPTFYISLVGVIRSTFGITTRIKKI